MGLPLGVEPFARQSRTEHAAVLVGGALACLVAYVGIAALLFGVESLAHGEPTGPRYVAAVFASLACWGFYSVAFMRGKGGPVTNVVAYPLVTVLLLPFLFRWITFGPVWSAVRERIVFVFFELSMFVEAAALVIPGLVFCVGLLALWASRLGEDGVSDWQRTHLSPEFRDEFVDDR